MSVQEEVKELRDRIERLERLLLVANPTPQTIFDEGRRVWLERARAANTEKRKGNA